IKTIRNYIDRELLYAEKWNGSWRITHGTLSEFYEKKYGIKLEQLSIDQARLEIQMQVSKQEYAELQQRSGKLQAVENQCAQQEVELRSLNERLAQLEASSASGWTEARKYKVDIESLLGQVQEVRKKEQDSLLEADWLRRELQRLQTIESEQAQRIKQLDALNSDLNKHAEALENELEECKNQMNRLKNKYRRDSFME
ncbi:MAG: hypothetical protein O2954_16275, partial [bacterium]|nr:hypothetical protein [bacterium]